MPVANRFLFSTSHPPAVAAACLAAFDVLEREPERIQNLWDNTKYFKQGLVAAGGYWKDQCQQGDVDCDAGDAPAETAYTRAPPGTDTAPRSTAAHHAF